MVALANRSSSLRARQDGVVEGFLELLWPTRCIGCEKPGALLCPSCFVALPFIDRALACERCGAPFGTLLCTECNTADGPREFAFTQAACAFEFKDIVARMIVAYKDQSERRLAPLLARFVQQALPPEWQRWADAISYIPCDRRALRKRGFDHMQHLAAASADLVGLPAVALLRKGASTDQRKLGRAGREENMTTAFSADERVAMPRHVLLLDDVFTTGATLDAASRVLLAAGAAEVRVASVARVW
ncbi:MAG: ComF family protein [Coriobacteriales bacterium]|jgi:ComF family protein|nr:ComF family protein [Coriobacteriales bacterium]